ncbi:class I SAM-dependent methyltransferase [Nocardia terpenica]
MNFLARIEPGFEYIGVDLTPSAVELANATYSRREILRYTCGDAEDLPFEDAEFDIVLSIESSHAYPNLEKFITEVSRVLRIGGTFGHADVFSESRLRSFRQLKTPDLFQWAEESDISTIVRASIAERISSDSKLRQSLTSADADKADLMLDLYGRPFLYMDRIPATDSDRLMESSYRVSIARRI